MKLMVIAVLCLAAATVWADDDEDVSSEVPEVSTRLEMIEEINVTAEKSPTESAEPADVDVEAILLEAEALETDQN